MITDRCLKTGSVHILFDLAFFESKFRFVAIFYYLPGLGEGTVTQHRRRCHNLSLQGNGTAAVRWKTDAGMAGTRHLGALQEPLSSGHAVGYVPFRLYP